MPNQSALLTADKLISWIPSGEPLKDELQEWRDNVLEEYPENSRILWKQLQNILISHVDDRGIDQWQLDVLCAWYVNSSDSIDSLYTKPKEQSGG